MVDVQRHIASLLILMVLAAPTWPVPASSQERAVPAPAPVWREIFARPNEIPVPADNPLSEERIALGRQLFSDPRLSGAGQRSCASCHRPELRFTDGLSRARGLDGSPLARNTPSLFNLAWAKRLLWDGRVTSLEAQVRVPIEHPRELGGDLKLAAARLNQDVQMRATFARVFPAIGEATPSTIARALASYERTLVAPPTRFDRWIDGDRTAMRPQELAGFRLFVGKAGCLACHGGWRFTDDRLHDIGLPADGAELESVTVVSKGVVSPRVPTAFKTPSLRGVAATAPYMHDGSITSLTAVLRHYAIGVHDRDTIAPQLRRRATLSNKEREQLIAFLRTL